MNLAINCLDQSETYISSNHFSQMKSIHTPKLGELYKLNLSVSMFHYIINPRNHRGFISSSLSFNSSYYGYPTRTNSNLSVKRFNRTASQSSFVYQGIKNCNMLRINLKSISTGNFKIKFKNHISSQYRSFFFF